MLRFLTIRRLAVIDSVEVEFEPGFNVLTGETGAGKSILVEAVGLLMGGRASGDLVRTGEDSATIEALFEQEGGAELVIRREISAQGRSRAFVNGRLTTASELRELASGLVEIHGQHEHQSLLDPATHLVMLDAIGGLGDLAQSTRVAWDRWRGLSGELARGRTAGADQRQRLELVRFQLAELERTAPKAGEDEELAASRAVLANAERITRLCAESYGALYERDAAVLSELGGIWRRVAELGSIDPRFLPFLEARDDIKSQLEDLAFFLRRYASTVDAASGRLQQVEERLARLESIKKRYGPTLDEVLSRHESLRREVEDLAGRDERLPQLEAEAAEARRAFLSQAESLSEARHGAAKNFARRLEVELADLAMEQTRFEVRFGRRMDEENWGADGFDQVEFDVSPNPGEELRPLAKIVSGGELSRIMLAIKTIGATAPIGIPASRSPSTVSPGLVFDEVDAGIGGRVADVVGQKLRALGTSFQVLCITHLPQIAAAADTHFVIEKQVAGGRTLATIARLTGPARVAEVGRMLAGAGVTDAVRASAGEILAARKAKAKGESESPPQAKAKARRWPGPK